MRIYHGCVPGTSSLQVVQDGMPQLFSAVPLRTGTAVHVIFRAFLFSSTKTVFYSLICVL